MAAPLDFAPVPPGTGAMAALHMRGADPDLIYGNASDIHTMYSGAVGARPAPLPNTHAATYSSLGGLLSRTLMTRDAALLASAPAWRRSPALSVALSASVCSGRPYASLTNSVILK